MSDEREDKRDGETPSIPAAAEQTDGAAIETAPPPPAPEMPALAGGGLGVVGVVATVVVLFALAGGAAFATLPMWRPVLARLLALPAGPDAKPEIDGLSAGLQAAEAKIAALSARLDAVEAKPAPIAEPAAPAPIAEPSAPPPARAEDQTDFGPRIDALTARLQALTAQIQAVQAPQARPEPSAPREAAEPDRALAQRVDQLRQQFDSVRAEAAAIGRLAERVEALDAKTATLGRLAERVEAVDAKAAGIAPLAERIEALDAALRQIAERRGSTEALMLAVAQLRAAVARGEAYRGEWEAVAALMNDQPTDGLEALAAGAAKGLPTHLALARQFEALAPRILRAEILPQGDGLVEQTLDRLSRLVSVRRTDEGSADSTSGRVAAAQRHLTDGDLAGAVAAVAGLTGPAAETVAPWAAEAGARLSADKALSELTARAAARAGAKAGG